MSSGRFFRSFCLGAAQIDAYGSANNSVIGSFGRPRALLPGTAGLADMTALDKRLIYHITDHSPRSLVERVDFGSGIGYLGGNGERARLGIGPVLVVTNLAAFDFRAGFGTDAGCFGPRRCLGRASARSHGLRACRPAACPRHGAAHHGAGHPAQDGNRSRGLPEARRQGAMLSDMGRSVGDGPAGVVP